MKKINVIDFFDSIGYDWKKDEENIRVIYHYTKTRRGPKPTNVSKTKLGYGAEQTFIVKALAEYCKAQHFFEIGTGRGTACYAVSLIPEIESILTVDIIPFKDKMNTAIGHKPVFASNKDIKKMIPFQTKHKISFKIRKALRKLTQEKKNFYDLCFIDGDHTKKEIIYSDFNICGKMMKQNGIIIFDDYGGNKKFAVKDVVDNILEPNDKWDARLIEMRGYMFGEGEAEKDSGMVVISKQKFNF